MPRLCQNIQGEIDLVVRVDRVDTGPQARSINWDGWKIDGNDEQSRGSTKPCHFECRLVIFSHHRDDWGSAVSGIEAQLLKAGSKRSTLLRSRSTRCGCCSSTSSAAMATLAWVAGRFR